MAAVAAARKTRGDAAAGPPKLQPQQEAREPLRMSHRPRRQLFVPRNHRPFATWN